MFYENCPQKGDRFKLLEPYTTGCHVYSSRHPQPVEVKPITLPAGSVGTQTSDGVRPTIAHLVFDDMPGICVCMYIPGNLEKV
jgi:hypothetical protein